MTPVYFIHLGPTPPPSYYRHSLKQARELYEGPIRLVVEITCPTFLSLCQEMNIEIINLLDLQVSMDHHRFKGSNELASEFRHGFWRLVVERFFVLDEVMEYFGDACGVHLEGDNLLFHPLAPVLMKISDLYENIGVPFDHDKRAVAGFIWFGSITSRKALCKFIADHFCLNPGIHTNDMELLGLFKQSNQTLIESLPVLPNTHSGPYRNLIGEESADAKVFSHNHQCLQYIFDANALGQYIDGIDPRNSSGRDTAGFINETAMHQFDSYQVRKQLMGSNSFLTPRIISRLGEEHKIFNLHVHSKRLSDYRRVSLGMHEPPKITHPEEILDSDIITSERLESLADVSLYDQRTYNEHHFRGKLEAGTVVIYNQCEDGLNITASQARAIDLGEIIFTPTHLLDAFINIALPRRVEPFVLITHASDHCIEERHKELLSDTRLLHWFAQNCTISHAKLTPIPIGLANRNWRHGDLETFNRVRHQRALKRRLLFSAISLKTNPKRSNTALYLMNNGFTVYENSFPFLDYLKNIKQSLFTASPEGNGVDCHRTWESIYLGSIPIIDHRTWIDSFKSVPMLSITDWGCVTMDFLIEEFHKSNDPDLSKASLGYWRHLISSYRSQ